MTFGPLMIMVLSKNINANKNKIQRRKIKQNERKMRRRKKRLALVWDVLTGLTFGPKAIKCILGIKLILIFKEKYRNNKRNSSVEDSKKKLDNFKEEYSSYLMC